MALETGSFIDDLVATNPVSATDLVRYGAGHLRLLKDTLKNSFAGTGGAILVAAADASASANTITLSPTPALTEYTNRMLVLWHQAVTNTGATTMNINGLGAKSVVDVAGNALTSGDLVANKVYLGVYNGTAVQLMAVTKNYVDQRAFSAALPAQSLGLLISDGATASFSKTFAGFAVNTVRATVASHATTADIWAAAGNEIDFTGAATVTDFPDAPVAGASRTLHCAGACTFTNNANIAVQGGANYTAEAGDVVTIHAITTSTFRATIQKADGEAVVVAPQSFDLLATLAPTAAANADALSTFTASYDNYLIIGEGVKPAANDILLMRCATGGAADTGSNYTTGFDASSSQAATTATSINISSTNAATSAGKGVSFTITIVNANDTANLKLIAVEALAQTAATPAWTAQKASYGYFAANAISGLRFYWSGGSNFSATGSIRIYGYNNT